MNTFFVKNDTHQFNNIITKKDQFTKPEHLKEKKNELYHNSEYVNQ